MARGSRFAARQDLARDDRPCRRVAGMQAQHTKSAARFGTIRHQVVAQFGFEDSQHRSFVDTQGEFRDGERLLHAGGEARDREARSFREDRVGPQCVDELGAQPRKHLGHRGGTGRCAQRRLGGDDVEKPFARAEVVFDQDERQSSAARGKAQSRTVRTASVVGHVETPPIGPGLRDCRPAVLGPCLIRRDKRLRTGHRWRFSREARARPKRMVHRRPTARPTGSARASSPAPS